MINGGENNIVVAGNIQPPASLTQLKESFKDFERILVDVDDILSPTTKILNDLIPILQFPADIKTALNELQEVIVSIQAATAALIVIPIVGEVVAGADEAIDDLVEIMKEAESMILVPMSDFCQPIENAIKKVETPLLEIDKSVVSLKSSITKWGATLDVIQEALALAAGIGNGFDAMGQQRVGEIFGKLVNAYNTVVDEINKPLGTINAAMKDIDKVLKPLGDGMSKLKTGTFDKIGGSVAKVESVLVTLNPLHEFLSHIQVVLKPFEWVLDKPGQIIDKTLEPILNPLLGPLEKKIMAVVGLPPDFQKSIQDALSDSTNSADTKKNSTTISSGQGTIAHTQENLETTMKRFVSGDINTICQNLLEIIRNQNNKPK